MAQAVRTTANRPVWVDLASPDAAASREFYSNLFGWQVEVNEDPQYGGYGLARIDGRDAAGIGPKMSPEAPTAWSLYIGSDDIDDLARRVGEAGGHVIAPPFNVGDQGRMAVFQDPSGAFISSWQRTAMGGFQAGGPNTYGWAELNARGVDQALPFYETVFGWTTRTSPMGEGQPPYTEFLLDGESVAGAWEMNERLPAEVPSYWGIYFVVDDVDDAFRRATESGASPMVPPSDFPGGRFAILSDPQGASFGLLRTPSR
jgi:predicted enzyme related to lactoylglutathione lyase